ncbi:MAG: T9SS type A sorting domain-containing protein [Ignavibacteriae bacterium]|nr:T9SS type A sorting domain-containing protein [Ignavibacteriota bacterium]
METKRAYIIIFIAISIISLVTKCASALTIDTNSFVSNQILSCPTDNSITIRIVPKKVLQIYYEYGTTSYTYTNQTSIVTSSPNVPVKVDVFNLLPNTRYYYRIRYKDPIEQQFTIGEQCKFMTQRAKGSNYVVTLHGDSHLYDKKGVASMMRVTMNNITSDNPDFDMEMGDTFGDDRNPPAITQEQMMALHLNYLPYIGMVGHSSPFFFTLGNHEGESGYWLLQTPPNNIAVWGTLARKYYYSLPEPGGFYSGNNTSEVYGIGLPQNYYAWEWGDALFVVLDVYRYCTASETPGLWDWTLGAQQYNWFKQTLENSNAKYKFVFGHHVRGYGRGGDTLVKYFEWGGYENNGTAWGFTARRPGWAAPVHQLMVQNHVQVFFQGHDHLFATEQRDGLIYQEIGMPSDSTYEIGWLANSDAYKGVNKFSGTGHIRLSIGPDLARVDYISAYEPYDTNSTHHNRAVIYSYTISPNTFVNEEGNELPESYRLEQNYPNPFNPSTKIRYEIPSAGYVKLTVYDALGHEIKILEDEKKSAGIYEEMFDASEYPSGIYFCRLHSGEFSKTIRMILLK